MVRLGMGGEEVGLATRRQLRVKSLYPASPMPSLTLSHQLRVYGTPPPVSPEVCGLSHCIQRFSLVQ